MSFFFVVACSALVAWRLRRAGVVRWIAAVCVPFPLSYCGYWLPVWTGLTPSEQYESWAPLGFALLFLVGLITSIAVAAAAGGHHRREAAGDKPPPYVGTR